MPGIEGPSEAIKLRCLPPSAHSVAEERWHPSQPVERRDVGSVTFSVGDVVTSEFRRLVYRFGRDVEALYPAAPRAWATEVWAVTALPVGQGGA